MRYLFSLLISASAFAHDYQLSLNLILGYQDAERQKPFFGEDRFYGPEESRLVEFNYFGAQLPRAVAGENFTVRMFVSERLPEPKSVLTDERFVVAQAFMQLEGGDTVVGEAKPLAYGKPYYGSSARVFFVFPIPTYASGVVKFWGVATRANGETVALKGPQLKGYEFEILSSGGAKVQITKDSASVTGERKRGGRLTVTFDAQRMPEAKGIRGFIEFYDKDREPISKSEWQVGPTSVALKVPRNTRKAALYFSGSTETSTRYDPGPTANNFYPINFD